MQFPGAPQLPMLSYQSSHCNQRAFWHGELGGWKAKELPHWELTLTITFRATQA